MLKSSSTTERWSVRDLPGFGSAKQIPAADADNAGAMIREYGDPDSRVVRTVTRMTVEVYEYTSAEFFGENLEGQ